MHAYVHPWSPNTGDKKPVKQSTFEAVSIITYFILVRSPFHWYKIFQLAIFFRHVKETNKTICLEVRFLMIHFYIGYQTSTLL